jgi:hypothetical protein
VSIGDDAPAGLAASHAPLLRYPLLTRGELARLEAGFAETALEPAVAGAAR